MTATFWSHKVSRIVMRVGNDTGAHSIILATCIPERWKNPWEQENKLGLS